MKLVYILSSSKQVIEQCGLGLGFRSHAPANPSGDGDTLLQTVDRKVSVVNTPDLPHTKTKDVQRFPTIDDLVRDSLSCLTVVESIPVS